MFVEHILRGCVDSAYIEWEGEHRTAVPVLFASSPKSSVDPWDQ